MVVFYRGHTLLVTSDVVEVWSPRYQRFAIADLSEVYVFRDVADPVVVRGVGAATVLVVAAAASWQFVQSAALLFIAVLVVLTPGVVGAACLRTRRPPWELRATHRGEDVQLFSTRDALTFGQVKRAIVRAMEANSPDNQSWRW